MNRIVATVLAAAFATAGVIAIAEMVNAGLDRSHGIIDWQPAVDAMARNTWSDTGPTIAGVILAAVGILLLPLGLLRGRPAWLPVRPASAGTSVFVSRDGIARSLADVAAGVDGVARTKARVGRRTATIAIVVHSPAQAAAAAAQVRKSAKIRLDRFDLAAPPKLKLKVKAIPPVAPEGPVTPESPLSQETAPRDAGPRESAPAPARETISAAGSSRATSTRTPSTDTISATEANFGVGAKEPTRPYPAGMDLTKPDPDKPDPERKKQEEKE